MDRPMQTLNEKGRSTYYKWHMEPKARNLIRVAETEAG